MLNYKNLDAYATQIENKKETSTIMKYKPSDKLSKIKIKLSRFVPFQLQNFSILW